MGEPIANSIPASSSHEAVHGGSVHSVPPPSDPLPDPSEMETAEETDQKLAPGARRDLRAEAHSLHHLLRHKPSNPYCEACRRGRMRRKPKFRGQHLTADHITSIKDNLLGATGDRNALVIKDIYSGLKHVYPARTKDADETTTAIRHFIGDRGARRLYSDNSGEIGTALKN